MHRQRVLILGAAGRDFHDFNLLYRHSEIHEVVGFTATQIPDIEGRVYPPELSGPRYPQGLPIFAEDDLEELIAKHKVDQVVFAYSDVPHRHVMNLASRAMAAGAGFELPSTTRTMIRCAKPVVAVTAVRTGVGKSQTTRYLARSPAEARHEDGRHPPPDALRRPRAADLPALRHLRRPRPPRLHDRGARGVRAPHRQRLRGLRRRRLRGDPPAGGGGGRRHPLGRRQQRHRRSSAPTSRSPWSIPTARATSCPTTRGRPTS